MTGPPTRTAAATAAAGGRTMADKGKAKMMTTTTTTGVRLPHEVLLIILAMAARAADSRPLSFLLLNRRIASELSAHIYRRITLSTYHALDSFSSLLLAQPGVRKHVRALWIGPRSLDSDLLRALAPDDVQLHHERSAGNLVVRRTHNILRSCRNIATLALSGKLISAEHAKSYGKACHPQTVWCVNPYSFVSSYLADILDRTEVLHLFDLTLAQEECATIVKMPRLRHFLWTTPSSSSTSTFASPLNMRSAAGGHRSHGDGQRYHPPREAALLWRLLLLSNPHTHNRKTRPPLRATFAAGSELVAEVEASLLPTPIPGPRLGDGTQAGEKPRRRRGRRRKEDTSFQERSGNGYSAGKHPSQGAYMSDDEDEHSSGASSDVGKATSGATEELDDGDQSDQLPTNGSISSHNGTSYEQGLQASFSSPPSSSSHLHPSSSLARAEALEASFRSLGFGSDGADDLPPPLFLYQPTPSLSSGHSGHHGGSQSHSHGHHGFDGIVEAASSGVEAEPGTGTADSIDPDAMLNSVSYDPPPPSSYSSTWMTTNGSSHSAGGVAHSGADTVAAAGGRSRARLGLRAASLSSLTSTVASTHGHSSHTHAQAHNGRSSSRNHNGAPQTPTASTLFNSNGSGASGSGGPTSSLPPSQSDTYRPSLEDIDAPNRLSTRIVPPQMVREWEALRDRVCPVHPPLSSAVAAFASASVSASASASVTGSVNSYAMATAQGGEGADSTTTAEEGEEEEAEEVDPGRALMRIWRLWLDATES